jgi:DNA-binding transcriptional MerR regulator
MTMTDTKLLRLKDAMVYYGVTDTTIQRWANEGKLKWQYGEAHRRFYDVLSYTPTTPGLTPVTPVSVTPVTPETPVSVTPEVAKINKETEAYNAMIEREKTLIKLAEIRKERDLPVTLKELAEQLDDKEDDLIGRETLVIEQLNDIREREAQLVTSRNELQEREDTLVDATEQLEQLREVFIQSVIDTKAELSEYVERLNNATRHYNTMTEWLYDTIGKLNKYIPILVKHVNNYTKYNNLSSFSKAFSKIPDVGNTIKVTREVIADITSCYEKIRSAKSNPELLKMDVKHGQVILDEIK